MSHFDTGCWKLSLLAPLLVTASLFPRVAGAAEIGIYFDAAGTQETLEVAAGEVFNFYAVAKGTGSGVRGYEFALEFSDAITILGKTPLPPANVYLESEPYGFNVGTAECYGGGGSFVLVSFSAFVPSAATNLYIRARATSPYSVDEETPAYASCDDPPEVYGFDETPAAYLNPKGESFGRIKERYEG